MLCSHAAEMITQLAISHLTNHLSEKSPSERTTILNSGHSLHYGLRQLLGRKLLKLKIYVK